MERRGGGLPFFFFAGQNMKIREKTPYGVSTQRGVKDHFYVAFLTLGLILTFSSPCLDLVSTSLYSNLGAFCEEKCGQAWALERCDIGARSRSGSTLS